jgi:hypothetical protein
VFTARYALSPYIKQIRFVFKGLIFRPRQDFTQRHSLKTFRSPSHLVTLVLTLEQPLSGTLWDISSLPTETKSPMGDKRTTVLENYSGIQVPRTTQRKRRPQRIFTNVRYKWHCAAVTPTASQRKYRVARKTTDSVQINGNLEPAGTRYRLPR